MYADFGRPVVNSQHVNRGEVQIDESNAFASAESARVLIEENDVVINGTGVGTIGRAAPYLYSHSSIPDNHVTVIKLKPRSVEPAYLAAYLNSVAGEMQVQKWLSGSSGQIELYPRDIARFIIALPPADVQQEIRHSYQLARQFRDRANESLQRAKRAVDIAIEQSESAALEYLAQS